MSENLSALYSHSYWHHPHIVKKQKKSFSASSQTKNEASGTIPSRLRLDTGSDLDLMTGTGMNCAEVTKRMVTAGASKVHSGHNF